MEPSGFDGETSEGRQESSSSRSSDGSLFAGETERPKVNHPDTLSVLLETSVLPQLIRQHDQVTLGAEPGDDELPSDLIEDFARLSVEGDPRSIVERVDELHREGISAERLYLGLLAPTAKLLGAWWVSDELTFTEVTIGLWHLQHALRVLSPAFQGEAPVRQLGRRVLVILGPGDQHSFGLAMLGEFFQRAGWSVFGGPGLSVPACESMLNDQWFDLVAISSSCDNSVPLLPPAIGSIRRAARNQDIKVMVGGRVFLDRPELVAEVGADASARDGRQAVRRAELLTGITPRGIR